jgi:hypothetical protein
VVLGVLLLAAAGLKAHGLALEPTGEHTLLSSPRLQIATVEVEVLLGLWLLSGQARRAAWAVALGFFGILAGVSLYLALIGQRSCGCFGEVQVSPWLTLSLDVAAIVALVIWRPRAEDRGVQASWFGPVLKTAAGALVILTLFVGAALALFDSPAEALAKLRGEAITVEPAVSEVGEGVRGEARVFRLSLTNQTAEPIRVVGGTTDCSCITTGDLPITLAPGETGSIAVRVRFSGSPGKFQHRFVLYTDAEQQRVVVARFAGRVTDPPAQ